MPGGDGTGPMGMGPMTGWGRGWCAGYVGPGLTGVPCGAQFGRGLGRGRRRFGRFGYGGGPWGGTPPEMERTLLERQVAYLGQMLAELQERLAELGATRKAGKQGEEGA